MVRPNFLAYGHSSLQGTEVHGNALLNRHEGFESGSHHQASAISYLVEKNRVPKKQL